MNYCKRQEAVWVGRADLNRLFFAIIWQNNNNERNTTPSTHATWHFLHACFFFYGMASVFKMYPPDIPLHFAFSYGMPCWALRLGLAIGTPW